MALSNPGIDTRKAGALVFRAALMDSGGNVLATGTTTLRLLELQSDGTFKTYDFADNTFKATAPTTDTLALSHRQASNNTVNTGLWTAALATVTAFTVGGIYTAQVTNVGSSPITQSREFQYGGVEGDFVVDVNGKVLLQPVQTGVTIPTVTNVGTTAALTGYTAPPTASDVATAVWGAGTRTLTGFGTLVADIWAYATRTITDKTGFSLTTAPPTVGAIRTEMDSNSTKLANLDAPISSRATPANVSAVLAAVAALQELVETEGVTVAEIRTLVGSWRRPDPATTFPGSETVIYGNGTGDSAGAGEIGMTVEYDASKQPLSKTEV